MVSILVGIVGFLSLRIATFEECEKAGLLTRSIRIYDGSGSVEKECFLWIGRSFVKQKTSVGELNLRANTQQKWETRTDAEPPVTVTVTPLEFGKDFQTWKFVLAFGTHSGSLDDDLMKTAILIDTSGNTYQPTAWEGAGPGGHHREGVLVFDAIYPTPASVTLKIKDVGGIPQRLFKWDTK